MSKAKRDKNGLRLDVSNCAWCGAYYDRETGATVDPPDDIAESDSFSHGMCKLCGVKVRAEMRSEMDDAGIMRLHPRDAMHARRRSPYRGGPNFDPRH